MTDTTNAPTALSRALLTTRVARILMQNVPGMGDFAARKLALELTETIEDHLRRAREQSLAGETK